MQLTKGAIGNLINRYRAVLKKCHLMNVFGSLAVAGMLVMGGAGAAGAAGVNSNTLLSYTGSEFLKNTNAVADEGKFTYTTEDNTITIEATGQTSSGRGVLTNLYNEGTAEKVSTTGLVVTNSTFAQNSQSVTGAGGGAVSLWGDGKEGTASLTHSITGTTFTENSATLGGAVAIMKQNAFDVAGTTNFTDDTFTNNSATNGGAIYAEKENITISGNTKFEGNTASQNGGAIFISQDSTLTIDGASFERNQADGWGGAILSGGSLTVTNTTFEGNIAGSVGGALGATTESKATAVTNSTFKNNHSVNDGGAIGNYGGMTIENCVFEGNTAQLDLAEDGTWTEAVSDSLAIGGGAISLGAESSTSISNTTFKDNISGTHGGAIATRMGAHATNSAATLDIDATFIGNKAQQGGAIYNTFYANNGLGKGDGVTVTGVFQQNTASDKGGAIFNDGAQDKSQTKGGVMTVNDSTFTGNTAVAGGAIYNTGTLTIANTTFENNVASAQGGAIYNAADSSITFTGTNTFSGNTAVGEANDIYNLGKITVTNGTTTLDGGLTLAGGTVNVTDNGTMAGTVTWAKGSVDASKGLIVIDKKGNVSLNGGMDTGDGASASVDLVTTKDGKVTLQGITADKNTLAFDSYPYRNVGVVTFGLGNETAAVDVTVSDSKFTNNKVNATSSANRAQTTAGGAAISFDANDSTEQSKLTISKSEFDNNTFKEDGVHTGGGAYGGAIGVQDSVAVTLEDVTLTNNTAESDNAGAQGGGYFQSAYGGKEATLTTTGLTVTGNTAKGVSAYGGGMALFGVEATITDATFSYNTANGTAKSMGGALQIGETGGQASEATITHSVFTNNKAEGTNGWGGAIYNAGTLTVNGGEFTGNEAGKYGGAIAGDVEGQGSLDITNATFTDNTSGAGGAIALWSDGIKDAAKHTITARFEGNTAERKGGAIAFLANHSGNKAVNASISGEFLNNSAGESGGAIHSERATLTITDATFSGNSSGQKGGAIYNAADSSITFTGTNTFSGNTAAEGGDIYNEGDLTFDGSNTSMEDMVLADGNLDVINSSLVYIGTLDARGGSIFVDPSGLIIGNLKDNKLGTDLVVGSGAITNIGNMDNDVLVNAIADAGMSVNPNLTTGQGNAVLALNNSIELANNAQIVVDAGATKGDNGTILVDGTQVTQTAYFGDDSLLVVNAANLTDRTAITAQTPGQVALVASDAKLRIINAKAGEWITVLKDFTILDETGQQGQWNPDKDVENLDYMLESQAIEQGGDIVVQTDVKDPTEALPGIDPDLAPMMLSVWEHALNDVDSPDMGVRFLSRAVRADYINGGAAKSAATIESAVRMALAGAVPQMTKMASDAATNAVVNRLGFANPVDGAQAMNAEGKIVDRRTTGFALWIAPLWQNMRGWGMEAGNLDYGFNGNLGGVSLGADYTFENAIRAGITFNIGGGYAESSGGDLNSTENRMTFWGLGAYAGWNYQNFGLMADVSYTSTWNDLKQDLDPGMGMGDLEADVQATAISAGLRAEYKLETSALDIIPHIGVRYMSLNTWGYDVDANGGTVLEGDGFHQDIWTFPIGVTFSKEITMDSGWFFKPSVDFSVIPAAGDIKAKHDVRFTGVPATAEMETQMMDYLTWQGGVGIQLGNDNLSFGVNYTLQAGQNTTGHGVFGNFRYEF